MNITVRGKVITGKKLGKQLGFPTANIKLNNEVESGVYMGWVYIDGKKYQAGVFVSPDGKLLEAHIIRYSGNLYGQEIKIEIGEKIRDVMKFESEEELKNQIKKDIENICLRA